MQKAVFLFPSMRSLPSRKAHSGSCCLPVTLHGSFFFLLYCRISLIFNIFIKNRISLHNLKEGRGNGSKDLFVEWFGTGKVISIIFREADGFLLLFSHSIKAGQDTIPKVDTVGELLGVESGSHLRSGRRAAFPAAIPHDDIDAKLPQCAWSQSVGFLVF
jgi:hypothetical protein